MPAGNSETCARAPTCMQWNQAQPRVGMQVLDVSIPQYSSIWQDGYYIQGASIACFCLLARGSNAHSCVRLCMMFWSCADGLHFSVMLAEHSTADLLVCDAISAHRRLPVRKQRLCIAERQEPYADHQVACSQLGRHRCGMPVRHLFAVILSTTQWRAPSGPQTCRKGPKSSKLGGLLCGVEAAQGCRRA